MTNRTEKKHVVSIALEHVFLVSSRTSSGSGSSPYPCAQLNGLAK
jgi:hypothetical protein